MIHGVDGHSTDTTKSLCKVLIWIKWWTARIVLLFLGKTIQITTSSDENTVFLKLFLTHWGRVTHVCVSKVTIIDSDNGLSPGRCQAIIWTNAGILLIGPLGINLSEILIEILTLSFQKMRFKASSAKWRPFCLGLNVLTRSISWLLMPWLLASPGHQQPWYWLCRIGRSFSYSRRNFNYTCFISVEEWHKM